MQQRPKRLLKYLATSCQRNNSGAPNALQAVFSARQGSHTLRSLNQWLAAVCRYSDNKNAERRAHGEPEIHCIYASAGHDVRRWLAAAGAPDLLAFIKKLIHGESSESAYDAANSALQGKLRLLVERP